MITMVKALRCGRVRQPPQEQAADIVAVSSQDVVREEANGD